MPNICFITTVWVTGLRSIASDWHRQGCQMKI